MGEAKAVKRYSKTCKNSACNKDFTTKRATQDFCTAKCRQQAFQAAKMQAEYRRGWVNAVTACIAVVKPYPDQLERLEAVRDKYTAEMIDQLLKMKGASA